MAITAEPVAEPGTEAGFTGHLAAGHRKGAGRIVIDRFGVHGTNHRDVVRNGFHVRQQLAHLNARLAAPLELEFTRGHRKPLLATGHRGDALAVADGVRQVLIEMIGQSWFMIEEINLRRRTIHVQVNQPLSLGRKMRQVGQGRMHVLTGPGPRLSAQRALAEHGGQRDATHLEAGTLEKLPAVLQLEKFVCGIHVSFCSRPRRGLKGD